MTSNELKTYINSRSGELCSDEIGFMLDIERHPQINHFEYLNNTYQMWDKDGNYFTFRKRNW